MRKVFIKIVDVSVNNVYAFNHINSKNEIYIYLPTHGSDYK